MVIKFRIAHLWVHERFARRAIRKEHAQRHRVAIMKDHGRAAAIANAVAAVLVRALLDCDEGGVEVPLAAMRGAPTQESQRGRHVVKDGELNFSYALVAVGGRAAPLHHRPLAHASW